MTQHPNHIEELREERIEWLREQIRRCSEVIERGAPDSWWYEDRSRYQHELRQLEEGPKLTNHIPTDSAYQHQASASDDRLREALEAVRAAMLNGGGGVEGDFGWNITALNKARPLIRTALEGSTSGSKGE